MDFASLYRQYANDVFRFAYFLSGNHAVAEDIAAETFARALTAGDRIQTATVGWSSKSHGRRWRRCLKASARRC
jgi:DNA-directed RNA polymerase specialized sigma24 family protein